MKQVVQILLLLTSCSSLCQAADLDTLTWKSFADIIARHHPLMTRAQLISEKAKAVKTQALGSFDPKLGLSYDRKLFDGTEYYSFLTPEIKVPLWYGLELKANYTEAEGAYINPENKIPKEGLSYAGLSIPLGKGLLIDRRRAAVKKARIFEEASENERTALLNDLYLDAGESYINWANKHRIYSLYDSALALAKIRFRAITIGYREGDKPAIDTIEALTQVQQREVQLQQASLELQQALYELSTFLWLENEQAVDPDKLRIAPGSDFSVPLNPETAINSNPKLLSYGFKLRDLQIDRRIKAEGLRPEINLQAGLLNTGKSVLRNVNADYWSNNNKVGLQVSFPLTFSTARGELSEAKIKIQETQIEQQLLRNDLENKMRSNQMERQALTEQLQLLRQSVNLSDRLLKGEEMKFNLGESSLFMLNSRESKLLEINEKLLLTEAKMKKAQLKTLHIGGNLFEAIRDSQ